MAAPLRADLDRLLTVGEFLAADPGSFGDAWRYELVDGRVVAHPAPTPGHGAIVVNLGAALKAKLPPESRCRAEAATAAVPKGKPETTARIPDVVVRYGGILDRNTGT